MINVIEELPERAAALRDAYTLTTRLLIVAARLIHEQPANHIKHHGDGIVTRTGTFQKFYTQTELRDWIDGTLNVSCIASAPGIFYVFTEEHDAQTFYRNGISKSVGRRRLTSVSAYSRNMATPSNRSLPSTHRMGVCPHQRNMTATTDQ